MTKKWVLVSVIFFSSLVAGFVIFNHLAGQKKILSPVAKPVINKPLEKYSFPALKAKQFVPGNITFDKVLNETDNFTSCLFFFDADGKKVSGLANLPKKAGVYPVIVQFRGFIPPENYTIGAGTIHSGEVFAKNGFITLAPDFLGYGESASPSADPLEERFETYTTALTLLASLPKLNQALSSLNNDIAADTEKVGIWGHSNGGHIALSVLAITGRSYPTVLWNPVSKPFPYSILYYSDELPDNGRKLRRMIADFEKDYDIEKYSTASYFDWITAPIQLHQAEDDEAVPKKWSDLLYNKMKDLGKNIAYFTYPGDNHDFNKGSWQTVVERNIEFYSNRLGANFSN